MSEFIVYKLEYEKKEKANEKKANRRHDLNCKELSS